MKKFTKNHQLVISMVALVVAGIYTIDRVPKVYNLREVVAEVIQEMASVEETTTETEEKGE